MRITPAQELEQRSHKLQDLMRQEGVDGAIVLLNADLIYFAGTCQQSHLFIPVQGSPVLMVKKDLTRARRESTLQNIIPFGSLKELPSLLQAQGYGNLKRIGLELDVLPAAQYLRYSRILSPAEVVDISHLIRTVRAVKSQYELEILRDAARQAGTVYAKVPELLQEGMTELELAGQLEAIYRKLGHQSLVRTHAFNMETIFGHLMSGASLAVPSFLASPTGGEGPGPAYPQSAGFKLIQRNEPVMVDYVGIMDGYIVDMTRIFCLGSLPDKMLGAHQTALEIQAILMDAGKPGVSCGELFDLAWQKARAGRYSENFMGLNEAVPFIGHGVGLELDELPVVARGVKTLLEEGTVLALEPKFIFPEGAVGIENTFVVTPKGLERISVFEEEIIFV